MDTSCVVLSISIPDAGRFVWSQIYPDKWGKFSENRDIPRFVPTIYDIQRCDTSPIRRRPRHVQNHTNPKGSRRRDGGGDGRRGERRLSARGHRCRAGGRGGEGRRPDRPAHHHVPRPAQGREAAGPIHHFTQPVRTGSAISPGKRLYHRRHRGSDRLCAGRKASSGKAGDADI